MYTEHQDQTLTNLRIRLRYEFMIFLCGDFSINLLNPHGHKKTLDFINTMFSISLYPMIIK